MTADDVRGENERIADTLGARGVCLDRFLLARDGLRVVGAYEAPDVDAVRSALGDASVAFDDVWPVQLFRELAGLPAFDNMAGRETMVCERTYPIEIPVETVIEIGAAARWCLEENNVELIDSFVPADNKGSICVYAAPDAESVRRANRTVKVPFDRVWPADLHSVAS